MLNYHAKSGGASVAMNRIAEGLEEAGMTVKIASLNGTTTRSVGLPGAVARRIRLSRRMESLVLRLGGVTGAADRSFNLWRTGIGDWVRNLDFDVVHLHWICRGMVSWQDLSEIGKPLVWTFHDGWAIGDGRFYPFSEMDAYSIPSDRAQLLRMASRRFARRRARCLEKVKPVVVTPSKWLASEVERFGRFKEAARCIHNPLDRFWDASRAVKEAVSTRRWVVGASGFDVDPRKGGFLLLQAIRKMQAEGRFPEDVQLALFGGGGVDTRGLPNGIRWLGSLSHEQIRNVFEESELFICPSLIDNFPNMIAEAQSCGCPVLATPVGGVPEMVERGASGELSLSASAESIEAAMLQWESEWRFQYRKNAVKAFAKKRYDVAESVRLHQEAYEMAGRDGRA
ncbi:glycosyltransferase [Pelagicoccus sp. SDUM812003]|nr:glycosyltransferase [Pelagicoccus sp. SDUM812003]